MIKQYLLKITLFTVLILLILKCTNDLTHKVKKINTFEPKIENVKIIDTIFQFEVDSIMHVDSIEIKILEAELKQMEKILTKIRNKEIDYNLQKREIFFKVMSYNENRLELYKDQLKKYEDLDIGNKTTDICGYVVKLEFNGHPNESVMNNEYKLLGPSFLFFNIESHKIRNPKN